MKLPPPAWYVFRLDECAQDLSEFKTKHEACVYAEDEAKRSPGVMLVVLETTATYICNGMMHKEYQDGQLVPQVEARRAR